MNIQSNNAQFNWFALLVLALMLSMSFNSIAEPYLAYQHQLKCRTCHINPDGGGLRNAFGRQFGQTVLPARVLTYNSESLAQITPQLLLGGDARFNARWQKSDLNSEKSFDLASGQFYLNFAIADSGLSFYLDQQVAPGSALNREAYLMYQFDSGHFIKAGRFFIPYGLRIEDDHAFIRQASGMNFDNGDNGVEFTLDYADSSVNFFIANGTSQTTNNDDSFLYGTRFEYLFGDGRIGASLVLNDGEQQSTLVNLYGGWHWRNFTLLASADLITFELDSSLKTKQLASLFEINYQWRQGLNFKLSAEYLDPDRDIEENEQTRYSLLAEYTVMSNLQLRFGVRMKSDIPQKAVQNYDVVFIQSHFYF